MSIHPVSAETATCPVAGCGCAQRVSRYPSDMTDAEWEVLGPQARAVMAELRHGPGGRPMTHRLRVVVDAIRYLVRYGVERATSRANGVPDWSHRRPSGMTSGVTRPDVLDDGTASVERRVLAAEQHRLGLPWGAGGC